MSGALDFFHRALHQLLRILELLEHERDIHFRFAGEAFALAVDPVLPDERERIGQQIERDREPAARLAHHRLVTLESVAMLPEDRRHDFFGFEGRSSIRLCRLRGWDVNTSITTSPTSSEATFQSDPFDSSPPENAVATDPGMM
jgi:hypothetical protein